MAGTNQIQNQQLPVQQPQAIGPNQAQTGVANNIVQQHPWMASQSPEITGDLINGGASSDQVDIVDHTSRGTAVGNAIAQHQNLYHSHSIWAEALGGVTNLATNVVHAVGHIVPGFNTVASWAGKGMQEMQKDFKFIGAIYKDRGIAEGLLATAGVVAGGILGSAVGPEGTAFGATLAAGLVASGERQVLGRVIPDFKQPLAQSNDPKFIMNPGHVVADALSKIPGLSSLADEKHGWGQTVSGLTDMGFDFATDPVMAVGKLSGVLKNGGFMQGVAQDGKQIGIKFTSRLANAAPAFQDWIVKNSGVQYTSEGIQQVAEYGKGMADAGLLGKVGNAFNPFTSSARNFYRAADTIAKTDNPVAIQALFPGSQLSSKTVMELAKAKDVPAVVNVLGDSLYLQELNAAGDLAGMANRLVLPTQTLARSWAGKGLDKVIQKAGDPDLDSTKNLLFPKKVAIKDADGNFLDAKGKVTTDPEQKTYQRLGGGLYTKDAQGNYAIWNALAGKVRTFTGYKSLSLSPTLGELNAHMLQMDDPNLGVTLYNMARYTMGKNAALEAATNVLKNVGNDAAFNTAYATLTKEIVKAGGIGEDSNLLRNTMSQVQRAHSIGPNASKGYANLVDGSITPGTKMRDTIDADGNTVEGTTAEVALHEGQVGSVPIMDFKKLRKEIQNANAYNRMYSSIDDGFTWFTERAFAPLTLLTTGFGIRVGAGEAMHEIMRNGVGSYLKNIAVTNALRYDKDLITNTATKEALVNSSADKLATSVDPEDLAALDKGKDGVVKANATTKHIEEKEALWDKLHLPRPVGYVSRKIAPYVAQDKIDVISRFQHTYNAPLPAAMTATHLAKLSTAAEDEVNTLAQLMRKGNKFGQTPLALFDAFKPEYHGYWASQLNGWSNSLFGKDIANDYLNLSKSKHFTNLSTDAQWLKVQKLHEARLNDMPEAYKKLQGRMVGLRSGDPASFATNQVQSLRGLVEGPEMTVHKNLINNIANGQKVTAEDLRAIPTEQGPVNIIGRVRPDSTNLYNKIIEAGHRNIIGPIIDHISREPIFNHYLYENYRAYKPAMDAGLIGEDDALRLAGQNAMKDMLPLIHNPALRSQMAMLHRNFAPFYFAQEQALKRAGRVIMTNPGAFREFQMIQQGMNNNGFVHTDASGQQYIVYPILGEFGSSLARGLNALGFSQYVGLPTSVTGSTQSLLSVLPEAKMPSVGPFVNVGVSQLANIFPHFMGLSKAADRVANLATGANPFDSNSTGHTSTSFLDTMIPNSSIRDLFNALLPNQKEQMVHSAMISSIASASYSGQLDKEEYAAMTPAQKQAVLDRIQHNAQTNLILKGILAFFLPLSPNVTNDYYDKNLQTLRSEFLTMVKEETAKDPQNGFNTAANKFIEEHGTNATSYTVSRTVSGSGGSSMPLSDDVLNWLDKNKSVMSKYPYASAYLVPQTGNTPDALKVEKTLLAMHLRQQRTPEDFLSAIYVTKGWTDLQSSVTDYQAMMDKARSTGNKHEAASLAAAWKQFTANYGLSNPIWYADYQNPTKNTSAQKALSELQELNSKNMLTSSNTAPGIKNLLASYTDYHALLQSSLYMNGQRKTPAYSSYVNAWNDYLNNLAISNPELKNVISGVFKRVI